MPGKFVTPPVRKQLSTAVESTKPQGFLGNVADSWMMDTSIGQVIQKGQVQGFANMFMPNDYDPEYNPMTDERLDFDSMSYQLQREVVGANDYDDALATVKMFEINIDRAQRLDAAGAGVTRFFTGFLDPINLIPVPLAMGRGFVTGFKRTLGPNAAIVTGTELIRTSLDPTDTPGQVVANIGFGTIMASTIGGLFGMIPKDARILSKMVDSYANIRERANEVGPNSPGRTMKELNLTEESWQTIKHNFPEGTRREDVVRGVADDGLGTNVVRFQALRKGEETFGVRLIIRTDENGVSTLSRLDGQKETILATGEKKDLVEQADTFGSDRVDNFADRQAIDLGQEKLTDVHPERPDPVKDPEGAAKYDAEQTPSDAPRDEHGALIPESNGFFTRHAIRDLADAEHQNYTDRINAADAEITRIEAEQAQWQRQMRYRNQHSVPRETLQTNIDASEIDLTRLRAQRQKNQQSLDETNERIRLAEKSNNPVDYMLSPTGTGLEKLYGRSTWFPFFSLTETKLVKLAPELAADWQRIAYRLAGSPGLQYRGGRKGASVGTSAEMQSLAWWHNFREAKVDMDSDYANLYGYGDKIGPTRQAVQEASQPLLRKLGAAERDVPNQEANLSFQQYRTQVGRALINSGKVVGEDLDPKTISAIETSAARWRGFFDKFKDEAERLGVFQTQESLARRIQKNIDYGEGLAARIEEWEPRTPRGVEILGEMNQRLDDLLIEIDMMEAQQLQMKGLAGNGDWLSPDYFFRIWMPEAVKAREGEFKQLLTDHFTANPRSYTFGRRTERSTDPDAISVRVDETYDNIIGEGELDDALGIVDTKLGKAQVEQRLEELRSDLKRLEGRQDILRETIFADVDVPVQVVKIEKPPKVAGDPPEGTIYKHPRKDGSMAGAFIRRDEDGNIVGIFIDEEILAQGYRTKAWRRGKVKGVNALDDSNFKSEDDWINFIVAHEKAHAKFPRNKGEADAAYENRINQAALTEIRTLRGVGDEGAPGFKDNADPRKQTPTLELRQIRRKVELYEDLLKNPDRIGHVLPTPLRSRQLDIHNREVMDYMETDIDLVAQRYLQKVAPLLEVTRNFGDRNLSGYRLGMNQALDEKIGQAFEDGNNKLGEDLLKEKAEVNKAVDNLRDMVLGKYGLSKNPAHWTGRATRLLTAWSNLTHMGKVILSALNDAGNFVGYVGFKRALGDSWRFTLARANKDANEWNIGRQEALWAGEAANIWTAARARALTDIGGLSGVGKFEQGMQRHQDRFFIFNLLTPWTDFMEGMTGTMAQSAIIRDALAIADGTIAASRLSEVNKLGMTPQLAKNIAKVWLQLPEETRKGRHILLANSDKWKDLGASDVTIRAFRAMLATEINNLVPAPKAADKPTFMHKNWGRVMFQYRGFSFAATSKIMMANLQRKDKRALSTMTSMIGISYIVDLMRQPDFISLDLDEQLLRAVERSAVAGIFLDVNQSVESLTDNEVGLRPMFGMDSFERDVATRTRVGEALGPSINQWATFAKAFLSEDADTADKTRAMRYIIPYNNLLYYSWLIDRIQRGATNALE